MYSFIVLNLLNHEENHCCILVCELRVSINVAFKLSYANVKIIFLNVALLYYHRIFIKH